MILVLISIKNSFCNKVSINIDTSADSRKTILSRLAIRKFNDKYLHNRVTLLFLRWQFIIIYS